MTLMNTFEQNVNGIAQKISAESRLFENRSLFVTCVQHILGLHVTTAYFQTAGYSVNFLLQDSCNIFILHIKPLLRLDAFEVLLSAA